MYTERNRSNKIARVLGFGLAMSAIAWLAADQALSATAGPSFGGGGPRMSTPSISTVGPRGPNFRTGPGIDRPKGTPEVGDQHPPRRPKAIVIVPPDRGGLSNTTVLKPITNTTVVKPKTVLKKASSGSPVRRVESGVPPAGEMRYEPGHVIIELEGRVTPQSADALARRFSLQRLQSQYLASTNSTVFRWMIPDSRSVPSVIRQLEADRSIKASPNYFYALSQSETANASTANAPADKAGGDPAQYALSKLRLPLAHGLAKGDRVLVAVIDSGVDTTHPEFAGVIAETFDVLDSGEPPHAHGTAIAGAIAAHSRLMGVAPAAKILAIRAFGNSAGSAEGTTFNIIKSMDWAIGKNAQVINMSFAGPKDPALSRRLAAARAKGIVLIAAAGNAGAKSPPLYPGADPNVIAVTATDSDDQLFKESNRGDYVAIAAPGVDILLPSPDGGYQVSSGTSFAAAHISGIAALILERKRDLKPDAVRKIMVSTAKDLGPKGRDIYFGAGLADAYQAVSTSEAGGPVPLNASASR
jgi:subtilisin family serine protease